MANVQEALPLVAALQAVLAVPIAAAWQNQLVMATYEADRAIAMLDNHLAGVNSNFQFIPERPGHPILAQANFPRNFKALVRLTAPGVQACIVSYGIVLGPGASIDARRRAIGRYIGVRIPR